ncbi:MAG: MoaD/ThiS family protein [Candidatus Rokubacteria bacterium]|nr:MoaD/ThiS family protein [Candidatus Rokubacteria bacterium]
MEQPRPARPDPPGRSPARRRTALTVRLHLFAAFAAWLPPGGRDGRAALDVPAGATVADVLGALGIPVDLARVILVNGHDAAADQPLADGDEIAIFPPLAGGSASGSAR